MRPTLIVMVKEPRAGRVKTRLGRDIGMTPAAWWYRHQTTRLLRRIADPRWRIVLAVSPDREGLQSRVWPQLLERWPQGRGDLGQRMARMFDLCRYGHALIIGSDIPGVDRAAIAGCFQALGAHDAVFGPAPDGGYWAIGLRHPARRPARLFEGVRWSSEHARADTEVTLRGHRIAHAATLRDVDSAADL